MEHIKKYVIGMGAALLSASLITASLHAHEKESGATSLESQELHPHSDAETPAAGHHHHHMMGDESGMMQGMHRLMMPTLDPVRGRYLFASKGCVACHSINGVGGHDATALDAHTMTDPMSPFEFAAKMWRGAPAMIYAQEEGLGEQILFTGDELSDIIAFVHDDAEQHKFSAADIPPEIKKRMNHAHGEKSGANMHGAETGHGHETHDEDGGHGMMKEEDE